nr:MAG TPA_asm: hypothetical protein [Caudoviricetes sp.]
MPLFPSFPAFRSIQYQDQRMRSRHQALSMGVVIKAELASRYGPGIRPH